METYLEKKFDLGELDGLSKKQIDAHLALYAGYVKNTNALLAKIQEYKKDAEANALALSELMRRFGFEFNGMRMHEYYFDQFVKGGASTTTLKDKLTAEWGSFENWMNEFKAIGKMRGIGWVALVQDDRHGNLHNVWITDHELGQLGGQKILLAMDVWEHAYLLDYLPAQRPDYIEAFFKNVNWGVIEARFA